MDLGYFMCSTSTNSVLESNHPPDSTTAAEASASQEEEANTTATTTTKRPSSIASNLSSFPELVESSCSSSSVQDSRSTSSSSSTVAPPPPALTAPIPPLTVKPGETSPSSLLLNRRLSTAIVTNKNERHYHSAIVEGRPVIVTHNNNSLKNTNNNSDTIETTDSILDSTNPPPRIKSVKMAVKVSPKSSPARPEPIADRSKSEKIPAASSMVNDDIAFLDAQQQHDDDDDDEQIEVNMERILEEMKTEDQEESSIDADTPKSSSSVSRPMLHRSQTVPEKRQPTTYRFQPPPLRTQAWSEPPAETFQVRGKNYMNDHKKVPSQQAAFKLFAVDLVNTELPILSGMCAHPEERIQLALQRELETGVKELPEFVFCVNLCVPGSINYHSVYYFGADKAIMEEVRTMSTPFGRLMHEFLHSDSDEFRDRTFKLIPRIVEGNMLVRRAVGSKPAILGRKIKQYYLQTDRYMEVLVDIASDQIAQRITKLCMGYLQAMTVDMMFLLESNNEKELPERIFGGVRLQGVDFKEQDGKRMVTQRD